MESGDVMARRPHLWHRGRTGVRVWAHLPRWRVLPRSWATSVVVEEDGTQLRYIEGLDHRPAFVPLAAGRHTLDISVMWIVKCLVTLHVDVDVRDGEVVDLDLVRPGRGAVGRRNVPTGVVRRR